MQRRLSCPAALARAALCGAALCGAALGGAALGAAPASAAEPPVQVVLVTDGPWDRNADIAGTFQQELTALLGDEFGVAFGPGSLRNADWTIAGIRRELDRALADPDVDVVVGLGLLASNELARRGPLRKPGIAPFIVDPGIQGIPLRDGRSGVPNLSYIASVDNFRRDIEKFREIVPFRSLVLLVTSTVEEAIPELAERSQRVGEQFGLAVTVVPVGLDAQAALQKIPTDAEAVYVTPLLRLGDDEFERLVAGLNERKLPTFSLLGRSDVERGVLAGLTPEEEFERIARRTALNIQRILLGEKAEDLPVHFANTERLALNVATARAIGVRPTWAILTAADQVDRERKVARGITLETAVDEALRANLDLLATERNVAAGAQRVAAARSVLLPQVEVSARGVQIDTDQAESSAGFAAERTLAGTASVTQILFSDDALTGLGVEGRQQAAREEALRQRRLDIAQGAATAYLNVLRAQTAERIQRENLERTETNLELARTRASIGYSGPGEVFRWEGEVATQRIRVIDANSQRNIAEIELNRIRSRPGEESFRTVDADTLGASLGIGDARLRAYLDDPWSFRMLREVVAAVAREASPELASIDASIAAQERVLSNTGRAFFLPTVGLSAEVNRTFDVSGAASDLYQREDTDWNVGIQATLPLFAGGGRIADRRGAREALEELRTTRAALEERIDQRVRSALHAAGSSFAAIALSRQAADAARRNYELVADGYSKGAVSVIDLIDAQNSSLVADQGAANAAYDFLIDYIEVERAAGFLSCLGHKNADDLVTRLEAARREEEAR